MGTVLVGVLLSEVRQTCWRGCGYTTVPNKTPTPAVIAIASAPQKVIRITLGTTRAPPARAANAPRRARKMSEAPATNAIRVASGAKAETMRGKTAPTAKLPADANAA